jgi:hypothetical protein
MTRLRGCRGTTSTFVVSLTLACLLAAGLALDGGRIVASRIAMADIAASAARAGAQEVVGLRGGERSLDPARARAAAGRVLAAAGATGTVEVRPDSVTVRASTSTSMVLLGLAGIGDRTVAATATARAEQG